MTIYEEQAVERKFEELSDQVGYLVLELLVVSLKKIVRDQGNLGEMMNAKFTEEEPF